MLTSLLWAGVGTGCQEQGESVSDDSVSPPPLEQPRPGSEEQGDPDAWVAHARALEAARRPVEALLAYRSAMRMAPRDWPEKKRAALEARIARLSFLMGVPGQVELPERTPIPRRTVDTAAVTRANSLLKEALDAEASGRIPDALALYRQVLQTITEGDDPALYWRAWQKVADLTPEGEGPGEGDSPGEDRLVMDASAFVKTDEDGMFLRKHRRLGIGEPEIRLGQARTEYVKGMDAMRAEDPESAVQAFEKVLDLIEEDQDPELYRAAQENLESLGKGKKTR